MSAKYQCCEPVSEDEEVECDHHFVKLNDNQIYCEECGEIRGNGTVTECKCTHSCFHYCTCTHWTSPYQPYIRWNPWENTNVTYTTGTTTNFKY